MTISTTLLAVVVQGLVGALLLAVAVAGLRKADNDRWARLTAARRERARPFVVGLVAGEPQPWPASRRDRAAAEALAVETLRKVRGEARTALVEALEARGVVERAVRRARRPGALGRARAADLLGLVGGERALEPLARLLADRSPVVRRVAARAIGAVGRPEGAVPLLDSLAGRRALPAGVVAMALVQIGPSCATALRAALHEPSATKRLIAAQLLGHHEVLAAAGDLADALEVEPQPAVRAELARALGSIGSPVAVPRLVDVLSGVDPPPVRAAAARALGRIGAAGAVDLLRAALEEDGHEVPHAAAEALHELGVSGRPALVEAVRAGRPGADHAAEVLAVGVVREASRR